MTYEPIQHKGPLPPSGSLIRMTRDSQFIGTAGNRSYYRGDMAIMCGNEIYADFRGLGNRVVYPYQPVPVCAGFYLVVRMPGEN